MAFNPAVTSDAIRVIYAEDTDSDGSLDYQIVVDYGQSPPESTYIELNDFESAVFPQYVKPGALTNDVAFNPAVTSTAIRVIYAEDTDSDGSLDYQIVVDYGQSPPESTYIELNDFESAVFPQYVKPGALTNDVAFNPAVTSDAIRVIYAEDTDSDGSLDYQIVVDYGQSPPESTYIELNDFESAVFPQYVKPGALTNDAAFNPAVTSTAIRVIYAEDTDSDGSLDYQIVVDYGQQPAESTYIALDNFERATFPQYVKPAVYTNDVAFNPSVTSDAIRVIYAEDTDSDNRLDYQIVVDYGQQPPESTYIALDNFERATFPQYVKPAVHTTDTSFNPAVTSDAIRVIYAADTDSDNKLDYQIVVDYSQQPPESTFIALDSFERTTFPQYVKPAVYTNDVAFNPSVTSDAIRVIYAEDTDSDGSLDYQIVVDYGQSPPESTYIALNDFESATFPQYVKPGVHTTDTSFNPAVTSDAIRVIYAEDTDSDGSLDYQIVVDYSQSPAESTYIELNDFESATFPQYVKSAVHTTDTSFNPAVTTDAIRVIYAEDTDSDGSLDYQIVIDYSQSPPESTYIELNDFESATFPQYVKAAVHTTDTSFNPAVTTDAIRVIYAEDTDSDGSLDYQIVIDYSQNPPESTYIELNDFESATFPQYVKPAVYTNDLAFNPTVTSDAIRVIYAADTDSDGSLDYQIVVDYSQSPPESTYIELNNFESATFPQYVKAAVHTTDTSFNPAVTTDVVRVIYAKDTDSDGNLDYQIVIDYSQQPPESTYIALNDFESATFPQYVKPAVHTTDTSFNPAVTTDAIRVIYAADTDSDGSLDYQIVVDYSQSPAESTYIELNNFESATFPQYVKPAVHTTDTSFNPAVTTDAIRVIYAADTDSDNKLDYQIVIDYSQSPPESTYIALDGFERATFPQYVKPAEHTNDVAFNPAVTTDVIRVIYAADTDSDGTLDYQIVVDYSQSPAESTYIALDNFERATFPQYVKPAVYTTDTSFNPAVTTDAIRVIYAADTDSDGSLDYQIVIDYSQQPPESTYIELNDFESATFPQYVKPAVHTTDTSFNPAVTTDAIRVIYAADTDSDGSLDYQIVVDLSQSPAESTYIELNDFESATFPQYVKPAIYTSDTAFSPAVTTDVVRVIYAADTDSDGSLDYQIVVDYSQQPPESTYIELNNFESATFPQYVKAAVHTSDASFSPAVTTDVVRAIYAEDTDSDGNLDYQIVIDYSQSPPESTYIGLNDFESATFPQYVKPAVYTNDVAFNPAVTTDVTRVIYAEDTDSDGSLDYQIVVDYTQSPPESTYIKLDNLERATFPQYVKPAVYTNDAAFSPAVTADVIRVIYAEDTDSDGNLDYQIVIDYSQQPPESTYIALDNFESATFPQYVKPSVYTTDTSFNPAVTSDIIRVIYAADTDSDGSLDYQIVVDYGQSPAESTYIELNNFESATFPQYVKPSVYSTDTSFNPSVTSDVIRIIYAEDTDSDNTLDYQIVVDYSQLPPESTYIELNDIESATFPQYVKAAVYTTDAAFNPSVTTDAIRVIYAEDTDSDGSLDYQIVVDYGQSPPESTYIELDDFEQATFPQYVKPVVYSTDTAFNPTVTTDVIRVIYAEDTDSDASLDYQIVVDYGQSPPESTYIELDDFEGATFPQYVKPSVHTTALSFNPAVTTDAVRVIYAEDTDSDGSLDYQLVVDFGQSPAESTYIALNDFENATFPQYVKPAVYTNDLAFNPSVTTDAIRVIYAADTDSDGKLDYQIVIDFSQLPPESTYIALDDFERATFPQYVKPDVHTTDLAFNPSVTTDVIRVIYADDTDSDQKLDYQIVVDYSQSPPESTYIGLDDFERTTFPQYVKPSVYTNDVAFNPAVTTDVIRVIYAADTDSDGTLDYQIVVDYGQSPPESTFIKLDGFESATFPQYVKPAVYSTDTGFNPAVTTDVIRVIYAEDTDSDGNLDYQIVVDYSQQPPESTFIALDNFESATFPQFVKPAVYTNEATFNPGVTTDIVRAIYAEDTDSDGKLDYQIVVDFSQSPTESTYIALDNVENATFPQYVKPAMYTSDIAFNPAVTSDVIRVIYAEDTDSDGLLDYQIVIDYSQQPPESTYIELNNLESATFPQYVKPAEYTNAAAFNPAVTTDVIRVIYAQDTDSDGSLDYQIVVDFSQSPAESTYIELNDFESATFPQYVKPAIYTTESAFNPAVTTDVIRVIYAADTDSDNVLDYQIVIDYSQQPPESTFIELDPFESATFPQYVKPAEYTTEGAFNPTVTSDAIRVIYAEDTDSDGNLDYQIVVDFSQSPAESTFIALNDFESATFPQYVKPSVLTNDVAFNPAVTSDVIRVIYAADTDSDGALDYQIVIDYSQLPPESTYIALDSFESATFPQYVKPAEYTNDLAFNPSVTSDAIRVIYAEDTDSDGSLDYQIVVDLSQSPAESTYIELDDFESATFPQYVKPAIYTNDTTFNPAVTTDVIRVIYAADTDSDGQLDYQIVIDYSQQPPESTYIELDGFESATFPQYVKAAAHTTDLSFNPGVTTDVVRVIYAADTDSDGALDYQIVIDYSQQPAESTYIELNDFESATFPQYVKPAVYTTDLAFNPTVTSDVIRVIYAEDTDSDGSLDYQIVIDYGQQPPESTYIELNDFESATFPQFVKPAAYTTDIAFNPGVTSDVIRVIYAEDTDSDGSLDYQIVVDYSQQPNESTYIELNDFESATFPQYVKPAVYTNDLAFNPGVTSDVIRVIYAEDTDSDGDLDYQLVVDYSQAPPETTYIALNDSESATFPQYVKAAAYTTDVAFNPGVTTDVIRVIYAADTDSDGSLDYQIVVDYSQSPPESTYIELNDFESATFPQYVKAAVYTTDTAFNPGVTTDVIRVIYAADTDSDGSLDYQIVIDYGQTPPESTYIELNDFESATFPQYVKAAVHTTDTSFSPTVTSDVIRVIYAADTDSDGSLDYQIVVDYSQSPPESTYIKLNDFESATFPQYVKAAVHTTDTSFNPSVTTDVIRVIYAADTDSDGTLDYQLVIDYGQQPPETTYIELNDFESATFPQYVKAAVHTTDTSFNPSVTTDVIRAIYAEDTDSDGSLDFQIVIDYSQDPPESTYIELDNFENATFPQVVKRNAIVDDAIFNLVPDSDILRTIYAEDTDSDGSLDYQIVVDHTQNPEESTYIELNDFESATFPQYVKTQELTNDVAFNPSVTTDAIRAIYAADTDSDGSLDFQIVVDLTQTPPESTYIELDGFERSTFPQYVKPALFTNDAVFNPAVTTNVIRIIYAADTDGDNKLDYQIVVDYTASPVESTYIEFDDNERADYPQFVYRNALSTDVEVSGAPLTDLLREIHLVNDVQTTLSASSMLNPDDIVNLENGSATLNIAQFDTAGASNAVACHPSPGSCGTRRGIQWTFNTGAGPQVEAAAAGFSLDNFGAGVPADLTGYAQLSFGVRRASGSVNTVELRIEDDLGNQASFELTGINGIERVYAVTTAAMTALGLDVTQIKNIFFVQEGFGQAGVFEIYDKPSGVILGPTDILSTSDITALPGGPINLSSFSDGGNGSTVAMGTTARGFQMDYSTGPAGFGSIGQFRYDLQDGAPKEFQDLTANKQIVFGISGDVSTINVEFEDNLGAKSVMTLDSILSYKEQVFAIDAATLAAAGPADMSKISYINFQVALPNQTGSLRVNRIAVADQGLKAQLIVDHINDETTHFSLNPLGGIDTREVQLQRVREGKYTTMPGFLTAPTNREIRTYYIEKEYDVTVGAKKDHPEGGTGDAQGFLLDGVESPELYWVAGRTYTFHVDTPGHPMCISTNAADCSAAIGGGEVTGAPTASGDITFTPAAGRIGTTVYYQSTGGNNVGWKIHIVEKMPDPENPPAQIQLINDYTRNLSGTPAFETSRLDIDENGERVNPQRVYGGIYKTPAELQEAIVAVTAPLLREIFVITDSGTEYQLVVDEENDETTLIEFDAFNQIVDPQVVKPGKLKTFIDFGAEPIVLRQTYILNDTEQLVQIHAIPDTDNPGSFLVRNETRHLIFSATTGLLTDEDLYFGHQVQPLPDCGGCVRLRHTHVFSPISQLIQDFQTNETTMVNFDLNGNLVNQEVYVGINLTDDVTGRRLSRIVHFITDQEQIIQDLGLDEDDPNDDVTTIVRFPPLTTYTLQHTYLGTVDNSLRDDLDLFTFSGGADDTQNDLIDNHKIEIYRDAVNNTTLRVDYDDSAGTNIVFPHKVYAGQYTTLAALQAALNASPKQTRRIRDVWVENPGANETRLIIDRDHEETRKVTFSGGVEQFPHQVYKGEYKTSAAIAAAVGGDASLYIRDVYEEPNGGNTVRLVIDKIANTTMRTEYNAGGNIILVGGSHMQIWNEVHVTRASLDGSGSKTLLQETHIDMTGNRVDLVVDVAGGKTMRINYDSAGNVQQPQNTYDGVYVTVAALEAALNNIDGGGRPDPLTSIVAATTPKLTVGKDLDNTNIFFSDSLRVFKSYRTEPPITMILTIVDIPSGPLAGPQILGGYIFEGTNDAANGAAQDTVSLTTPNNLTSPAPVVDCNGDVYTEAVNTGVITAGTCEANLAWDATAFQIPKP
ncbi:MAG: hypothetical protein Q8R76_00845 [Candidatus Omnitrophota bacterium]|nr:hypothetical protein [Candidatus Omnitrophota bacterium]